MNEWFTLNTGLFIRNWKIKYFHGRPNKPIWTNEKFYLFLLHYCPKLKVHWVTLHPEFTLVILSFLWRRHTPPSVIICSQMAHISTLEKQFNFKHSLWRQNTRVTYLTSNLFCLESVHASISQHHLRTLTATGTTWEQCDVRTMVVLWAVNGECNSGQRLPQSRHMTLNGGIHKDKSVQRGLYKNILNPMGIGQILL